ncbi:MAG: tryptophan-rich sensory protein [Microlunatus sp.]
MSRTALVTGATGAIGSRLVPALLDAGWRVRVLSRSPGRLDSAWRGRVEVIEGDAADPDVLRRALDEVDVGYYLLHSMSADGDFVERDRRLARGFADAASAAGAGRLVYLGGLHPDGELSPHLASRVEVGEILLDSGVPTAVLQAGVVLGAGSASFAMLRHLTERLPVMVGPKWLQNRIQPIALDDAVHYLVRAAELPPEINRTIDIGMDEVLTYAEMMQRYARVAGLAPRLVATVPVLTPWLASHWVGLVTPVAAGVAKPLVGSLIHEAVRREDDADRLLGDPAGGLLGYDEAVRRALTGTDPKRWSHTLAKVGAAVTACAVVGSVATAPDSGWYRRLRKPSWQPPPAAFPLVWTSLYAAIMVAATATIAELEDDGREIDAADFWRALLVNLGLNAGWSVVFFRLHRLPLATVWSALLTVSSADLARRAAPTGRGKAAAFGVYAGWTSFATALSGALARRNPRH